MLDSRRKECADFLNHIDQSRMPQLSRTTSSADIHCVSRAQTHLRSSFDFSRRSRACISRSSDSISHHHISRGWRSRFSLACSRSRLLSSEFGDSSFPSRIHQFRFCFVVNLQAIVSNPSTLSDMRRRKNSLAVLDEVSVERYRKRRRLRVRILPSTRRRQERSKRAHPVPERQRGIPCIGRERREPNFAVLSDESDHRMSEGRTVSKRPPRDLR